MTLKVLTKDGQEKLCVPLATDILRRGANLSPGMSSTFYWTQCMYRLSSHFSIKTICGKGRHCWCVTPHLPLPALNAHKIEEKNAPKL